MTTGTVVNIMLMAPRAASPGGFGAWTGSVPFLVWLVVLAFAILRGKDNLD
jgi:hypothetical protein